MVDCVTSLGGVRVGVDANRIDIAYSGTQKCVGAPPSMAPLSMSEAAVATFRARSKPVQSLPGRGADAGATGARSVATTRPA